MGEQERAVLWVRFMAAALASTDTMTQQTEAVESPDFAKVAAKIADFAMKEFQSRFPNITSIKE